MIKEDRGKDVKDSLREDKIIFYKNENGDVELRADVKEETVWASINQVASIFDVQKAAVSKHLKNIYQTGELAKSSTVSILETVQIESNRTIKRNIEFYNLDVIIAVGCRVNSKKATQFRIWATSVLRNYLTKGYSLSKYRLNQSVQNLNDLDKAITFIKSDVNDESLKGNITVKLSKDIINKTKK